MDDALAKIRPHTSSNLPHQKAPANLLGALEATFDEQKTQRTPAAYFAGLITALESTVQKERETGLSLGEGDLLPAELYLLALVAPYVPPPVIRLHLNTIILLTSPLWPHLNSHAPPLRSQLSLYEAVLRALDRATLENAEVKQSFATILQFTVDSRPKVRRKAVELVKNVLESAPPPLIAHPYSERVGEWVLNALSDIRNLTSSKQKSKKNAEDLSSSAIHLLAFVKPVLPFLPSSTLPAIVTSLLSFPRLGNPFLSQSVYGVLSDLLSLPADPSAPRNFDKSTSELLQAVITSPPSKADTVLVPNWIQVIGKIMLVCRDCEPDACESELPKVWKLIFAFLESEDVPSRREAADTLVTLTKCISRSSIDKVVSSDDAKASLRQFISQLTKALDSLAYARAIPELFFVISSLITALRYRPQGRDSPTAAERLALPLIQKVGDMRLAKSFEYKEAADQVLRSALATVGPEVILRILPLNLEPEDRANGKEPRAFLLPLLVHPHPSPLGHFISHFVPLSERMFDLQQKAEVEGRASEAKVWSVLVSQIWHGLPAYCYRTPDLRQSLTPQFSQMLSHLLYNQPELRPPVLRALKVIVESNAKPQPETDSSESDIFEEPLSDDEIAQNKAYLQTQSESWFGVLFNLFGVVGRDGQGPVGEVISCWASIASEKEMAKTCRKITELFKGNLEKVSVAHDEHNTIVTNMQDILTLLVPYMSAKDAQTVFDLSIQPNVLKSKDNGVQKRAYKLLTRITQSGKISIDAESIFAQLDEVAEETLSAAKKDRLHLFKALLEQLPSSSLHVIPSIIPETVLGTKEPSEKARTAAFDLVVAMGHKMKAGGIVKRHKLNGMEEDDMAETPADLQEYFTMLAGGLAGATPHMISATITSISRLVFEFRDEISPELQAQIFVTMLVFVTSANREIVKSALGFVKLSVHSLPVELLRPHLKEIVQALLGWSHDHKNHFKDKVRHIFERMIRRFGFEEVYACAGEEEAAKVLVNIKKRKDRAKRKKAARAEAEGEYYEDEPAKATTGDAFEDVLYGSDTDSDDSESERKTSSRGPANKSRAKDTGARLRLDGDEPMDLLAGASTHISNKRVKDQKKSKDSEKFKTDEDTGKIVIDEEDDSEEVDEDAALAGAAYKETLTSADGFTRGPNGRIKFNKDTKKRRRENADADDDVEMEDMSPSSRKKMTKKGPARVGQEFQAKNAGGDVKRGGVDPYAYLSLSQASKGGKSKGRNSFTLTGRR